MKRLIAIVILALLVAIAVGVIFGLRRAKQRREQAMTEFYLCETRFKEGQYQSAAQLLATFLQDHRKSEKAADAYYYLAMTQEELGKKLGGISRQNISHMERGIRPISKVNAKKLAKIFEVSVENFI